MDYLILYQQLQLEIHRVRMVTDPTLAQRIEDLAEFIYQERLTADDRRLLARREKAIREVG